MEKDHQEHVLERLIGRQQWQAALTACDDNETLQVSCNVDLTCGPDMSYNLHIILLKPSYKGCFAHFQK